jgi:hypothetical protein
MGTEVVDIGKFENTVLSATTMRPLISGSQTRFEEVKIVPGNGSFTDAGCGDALITDNLPAVKNTTTMSQFQTLGIFLPAFPFWPPLHA